MAFIHVLKISIKWHWKTEHRDNQLFLHKSNAGFGYLFSNVNIKSMKDRYNKDWVSLFPRNVPYFKAIQKSVVFGYLLSCWVHFCPPHVSPLFPLSIQMFNVDFFILFFYQFKVSLFWVYFHFVLNCSNLARIERSAQKEAKSGTENAGWHEEWWAI